MRPSPSATPGPSLALLQTQSREEGLWLEEERGCYFHDTQLWRVDSFLWLVLCIFPALLLQALGVFLRRPHPSLLHLPCPLPFPFLARTS